jgi:hypothetical protein
MRDLRVIPILTLILLSLTACTPNPATAPCLLSTDPAPLVITADTYDLTFFGLNFAPDAYLGVYGTTFTYFSDASDYYGHTCPLGSYAMFSFEDAYAFFSSFRKPPYSGRFRVFNVGADGVNDGGLGDDKPTGFVAFSVQ